MAYADYLHCESCDVKVLYYPDEEPDGIAVFCARCWKDRHAFTRDQLIDALTRLEARVAVSGPAAGKILADSMADAIIGALEDRSEEGKPR